MDHDDGVRGQHPVPLLALLSIFLKAGLAFGGGLGVLAVLDVVSSRASGS
jgi:hypothetical protein